MRPPMEDIIGSALLGMDSDGNKVSRDLADARMDCNLESSHKMICGCGSVLDQSTVCIVSVLENDKKIAKEVMCEPCYLGKSDDYDAHVDKIREHKLSLVLRMTNWDGHHTL